MKLAKILAGAAVAALSAAAISSAAHATSYTECTWFNSEWDVCTTYTWNWDTGTWDADTYFVYTGEYATIDP